MDVVAKHEYQVLFVLFVRWETVKSLLVSGRSRLPLSECALNPRRRLPPQSAQTLKYICTGAGKMILALPSTAFNVLPAIQMMQQPIYI